MGTSTAAHYRTLGLILLILVTVGTLPTVAHADTADNFEERVDLSDPNVWLSWQKMSPHEISRLDRLIGYVPTGKGMSVTIPVAQHEGVASMIPVVERDDLWWRFWMRLPAETVLASPGKLPGVAGLYSESARGLKPPTEEEPGWSVRMLHGETTRRRNVEHTALGWYVYDRDMEDTFGEFHWWDPEFGGITADRWTCIEGFIDVPGGHLRAFVDGIEVFNHDGFTFTGALDAGRGVTGVWWDVYFGGPFATPTELRYEFAGLGFGATQLGCRASFTPLMFDSDIWNGPRQDSLHHDYWPF